MCKIKQASECIIPEIEKSLAGPQQNQSHVEPTLSLLCMASQLFSTRPNNYKQVLPDGPWSLK